MFSAKGFQGLGVLGFVGLKVFRVKRLSFFRIWWFQG